MGNYVANKSYHSSQAVHNGIQYINDKDKTALLQTGIHQDFLQSDTVILEENLQNALYYTFNQQKTTLSNEKKEVILVSGYNCNPDQAEKVFADSRKLYYLNKHEFRSYKYRAKVLLRAKLDELGNPILDENGQMIHDEKAPVYHNEQGKCVYTKVERWSQERTAYMWVQSFPPAKLTGEAIDPKLVHQIGLEFCEKLGPFACTVATHVNTDHIHNHVMMSAFSLDGTHKWKDNMDTINQMREISNDLSLKYDLPILLTKDLGQDLTKEKWHATSKDPFLKSQMLELVNGILHDSNSIDNFRENLKSKGITLRETEHHYTYISEALDFRVRDNKLSNELTKDAIEKAFLPDHERYEETLLPVLEKEHFYNSLEISKYTSTGRKRSELEMMLLKAINMVKILKEFILPTEYLDKSNNTEAQIAKLTDKLEKAISVLNTYDIDSQERLKAELNKTGIEISKNRENPNPALNKKYQQLKQAEYSINLAMEAIDKGTIEPKHLQHELNLSHDEMQILSKDL